MTSKLTQAQERFFSINKETIKHTWENVGLKYAVVSLTNGMENSDIWAIVDKKRNGKGQWYCATKEEAIKMIKTNSIPW